MLNEKIHLNKYYKLSTDPIIEITVIDTLDVVKRASTQAIIVVPGGGYDFISKREGDPICAAFMLENYITCKLTYSVDCVNHSYYYPMQHLELTAAMDYLYKNADKYSIDRNKIAMIGFSAGAHLVGSYCYKYLELGKMLGISDASVLKPKVIALCYPVISLIWDTHIGTRDNITHNDLKMVDELTIEKHIDETYPPTFAWTTLDDNVVGSISTKLLDEQLTKYNIDHKTIYYPHGPHGLSLATKVVSYSNEEFSSIKGWINECFAFFSKEFQK